MKKDQAYIIGLCDAILGCSALTEHRFDYLRGDPNINGRTWPLRVDAYYPSLELVIEYCELQHTEAVPFFDKRETISGMSRAEQRRRYDNLRLTVLPAHGIRVLQVHFYQFNNDSRKRLMRDPEKDSVILHQLLAPFITTVKKEYP